MDYNISDMNVASKSIRHPIKRIRKTTRLKVLALEAGFSSLKELAEACGVKYQHLYKVIVGERDSEALRQKLVSLLGPEVLEVFDGNDED